ncbi:glycoside hydrolase family 18 protein [Gymnopus androsaceus JB14]|uniref:chitinase n=1 Tax=Gymnopus androsaceus JB14 TaxID=1447944 RepID=A0A6A4HZI4_9AGAR|nr:glycoside hydrolase family 18 protein [Gymnopus androsaceus JB14]
MISTTWTSLALLLFVSASFAAFDPTSTSNLVAYWGQNSFGATDPDDTAGFQTNLGAYCAEGVVDVFPLAFLDVFFSTGGLPEINFANICNNVDFPVFAGSELANCQFMAADIEACQAAGVIVTLSMGGASGGADFTSDEQAVEFATLIWDLFLGGTSDTRPFGSAVLDGIDLDIEGGTSTGLAAFVTQIRNLAAGADKPYFISGAPQCPFPDAFLGSVIDAVGFDMIYVQFYNNFCELTEFSDPNDWNFATWDNWAKTASPNPDVKVFIGAPAAPLAAGSGYVAPATLTTIVQDTKAEFSSFGGVMLWDISQAVANDRFDISVKDALNGGSSAPTSSVSSSSHTTTVSTPTSSTPSSTTSLASNGNCAGISAWVNSVAYEPDSQVTFDGDLWTSTEWSDDEIPGGAAGIWVNNGACTTEATLVPAASSPAPAASLTAAVSAAPVSAVSAAPASSAVSAVPASSAVSSSGNVGRSARHPT